MKTGSMYRYCSFLLILCLLLPLVSCRSKFPKEPSSADSHSTTTATTIVTTTTLPTSSGDHDTQGVGSGTEKHDGTTTGSHRSSQKVTTHTTKVTQSTTKRPTVMVTITEGETLTQIFKKLEKHKVSSFNELMKTAESYDYSYYPLIAARPDNKRTFKLEGYLFPDTYEFYINEKPQDAIGKFLRNGKSKITDAHKQKAAKLGYNMDEILTVASIIQKEGSNPKEVSKIAAVLYNRLKIGQKLEMDCTINYIENHVKPFLSGDKDRYNSIYNTYKCKALPAGPVSNPGMTTISAALNPADVPYLYFCHDKNAKYYYASTYEEHQENLQKAGIVIPGK